MKFLQAQSRFLKIASLAIALFAVSSVVVFAQGFIGPSEEAPEGNVLDFISESTEAQGRFGKLRVDSADTSNIIPQLDVIGNVWLQGNVMLSQQDSGASLFVSNSTIPTFAGSGTTTANGKYNIFGSTGPGLYAAASADHAIFVKSDGAGTPTTPTKAIYGRTVQLGGGETSSGVVGESTVAGGAGIFGENANCPGTDISACGYAGQFIGNVVVTGKIQGDGRGVFKTWTLQDGSGGTAGSGISVKTFDYTAEDLQDTGGLLTHKEANALAGSEKFMSMSILVKGEPYDSARGFLDPSDANYLSFSYDTANNELEIQKNVASVDPDFEAAVLIFYQQSLAVNITDEVGNPVPTETALINSNRQYIFQGNVGIGGFGGGEFIWSLHTDAAGTSPACQNDNLDAGGSCGRLVQTEGQSTIYIPPNFMPANQTVYLKAAWTSDLNLFGMQAIDLYDIEFTLVPAAGYLEIGSYSFDFNALGDCPGAGGCSISWTKVSSNSGETLTADGLYTSPALMGAGTTWNAVVRAQIVGYETELYRDLTVPLLPPIVITATNSSQAVGLPNSWTDLAQVGTGQQLTLVAQAQNIPALSQYDFNWSISSLPALGGETLYNDIGIPTSTTIDNQDIVYTSSSVFDVNNASQRVRYVRATWRANGGATLASKTIAITPGQTVLTPTITLSRTVNTSGVHSNFVVNGFSSERRIYSFCTSLDCSNEIPVDYANLPLTIPASLITCGTLRLDGPATSNICNPLSQACTLPAQFFYTAAGSACSNTIRVKLMGDTREYTNLTVSSTGSTGCTCNPKTGTCCIGTGDVTETGGGGVF